MNSKIWSGTPSASVTFTGSGTNKITVIKITYTDASSSNKTATKLSFEKPVCSFATIDDLTSFTGQKATLTAEGAGLIGKTITYSKTGDDIFSSFNEADGTLALNGNAGTATVTANFDGTNDETYNSSSASYTITVNNVYGSLADLKKDITKAEKTFTLRLTNAVVSYAVDDRVYIEDETTGILIYYTNASNDLKAGQKLNGDVTVKAETYYNLPEITAWTPITLTAVDGSDIPLTKLTIADLINDYDKYEGRRIILENATVTTGTTGGDRAESGKISQGENEITLRTVAGIKTTKDDVIDVIGFLGKYNTGLQYNVFSQADITVKSSVEATTLSFDTEVTEFNVEKGKEKTFTAPKATVKTTATGEIVEGAKVTYESNAPTIAAVDAEGNVTFGSVFGTATITASYSGDATHRASKNSYTINYGKIKPTMAWSAPTATANLGETSFDAPTLTLKAGDVDILDGKAITYSSSATDVAEISAEGNVKTKAEGTTVITATFAGDDTYTEASAEYTLTVTDPNKLEVTFDFANNKYGYGTSKNNDGVGDVPVNGTIVSDNGIVTITNLQDGTNNTTFYADNLRFYKDSRTSISVPAGYVLKKIISSANMVGNSFATWTSGEMGETAKEWVAVAIEDVNSVTFTANSTIKMANMTVYYAKVDLPTVTFDEEKDDNLSNYDKKTVNVTMKRTIGTGYLNPVCFPFAMDATQIAEVFGEGSKVSAMAEDMPDGNLHFDYVETMEAGMPYLVEPTKASTTIEVKNVTINAKPGYDVAADNDGNLYSFQGVFNPYAFTATDGTELFLGKNNTLYMPQSVGQKMKGFRAYFTTPKANESLKIVVGDQTTTISSLMSGKTMTGKVYNLNGQYVGTSLEGLAKGIYVMNGQKFVVK